MPLIDADLMRLEAELEQRGLQRGQHGEIAAARTPVGMDAALEGVLGQLAGGWVRWWVQRAWCGQQLTLIDDR